MKVRTVVMVVVVLLTLLVVPAIASANHISGKSEARHPYGWAQRAPADQAEYLADRHEQLTAGTSFVLPGLVDRPFPAKRGGLRYW